MNNIGLTEQESEKVVRALTFTIVRREKIPKDKINMVLEALRNGIDALLKQIPKKWDCTNTEIDSTIVCPVCKKAWNVLDNDTQDFDYCPKCGQRLGNEDAKV